MPPTGAEAHENPAEEMTERNDHERKSYWKTWVARPTLFSIADLKSYPSRSHITELACEEGWSYIAEWIGVPLTHVLHLVGVNLTCPLLSFT